MHALRQGRGKGKGVAPHFPPIRSANGAKLSEMEEGAGTRHASMHASELVMKRKTRKTTERRRPLAPRPPSAANCIRGGDPRAGPGGMLRASGGTSGRRRRQCLPEQLPRGKRVASIVRGNGARVVKRRDALSSFKPPLIESSRVNLRLGLHAHPALICCVHRHNAQACMQW
jgi:hypothetical protein